MEQVVTEHGERHDRRVAVGQLGLLDQQDVRSGAFQPALDGFLASLERVDVPGRDPHRMAR
jgi:hypothetical protein